MNTYWDVNVSIRHLDELLRVGRFSSHHLHGRINDLLSVVQML